MTETLRCHPADVEPITDPTTGTGEISIFPEAFGQDGRPFVLLVEDPPNRTRERHYHHGDVTYFYVKGEHHIEGEGTYRAGDVRWTRGGHVYGPETTGADGGAWWVVSAADPIPVDVPVGSAAVPAPDEPRAQLTRFDRPYDWAEIDRAVSEHGGAIARGLVADDLLHRLNHQLDEWLVEHDDAGRPASGSVLYDQFLGARTVRLHGLVSKVAAATDLLAQTDLRAWVDRMLAPVAASVLLNAGELIEIGPSETTQYLHRDSDSWPLPTGVDPLIVNAIIAMGPVTTDNGATHLAPGSYAWDIGHATPRRDELARAEMNPGDALLFRGDLLHGGGANATDGRRRVISLSYCAGWLRPVENSFLNVPIEVARTLPREVQELLGFASYDGTAHRGGMLGLYENGDPTRALVG